MVGIACFKSMLTLSYAYDARRVWPVARMRASASFDKFRMAKLIVVVDIERPIWARSSQAVSGAPHAWRKIPMRLWSTLQA